MKKKQVKKTLFFYFKKIKGIENSFIKIYDRKIIITKEFLGLNFAIHNGKYFIPVKILKNMIGLSFGSLAFTKKIRLKRIIRKKK